MATSKPTRKMLPKKTGKPSAKELLPLKTPRKSIVKEPLPLKTPPNMRDMRKNRPASKNDMINKKKSGPKSWNNGYTN